MASASRGATRSLATAALVFGGISVLTLCSPLLSGSGPARADVVDGLSMRADPDFDYADLTPAQQIWYDRLVEDLDRSASSVEGYANGRDLYRLARTVGSYNLALLRSLRATGDVRFLDRMAELSEMFRATLADEWLDGTTDGYLNWIYLQEEGSINYGKDIIPLEEAMMHGHVGLIAYAFHVNRGLGPSYAEMADFWLYYLEEHFLAKWTERAGDPVSAWESGSGFYKRLAHARANQLRLAVYLWLITGDSFYLERANVIGDHLLGHTELNPAYPNAYRWKHQVSGGDLGWQKINYASYFMQVVVDMHLEEFSGYADGEEVVRFATTFSDAVYGPFAPDHDMMALRVDGSETEPTALYELAALSRWESGDIIASLAESRDPHGTYGVYNAAAMLLAVSPPRSPGAPTDISPPAAITDLAVTGVDTTSAFLSWTAPGDDGNTGTAEAYEIRWSLDSDLTSGYTVAPNPPVPAPAGSPETSVLGGLPPETTLYIAIRTRDDAGLWSPLSNAATATTDPSSGDPPDPDTVAPARVTDLEVVELESQSVVLAWTATGDDQSTGRAHHYDLRFATAPIDAGSFDQATPVFGLDDPRDPGVIELVTVNGLTPDTRYYFAVVVEDDVGNRSPVSNAAEGRTGEGEAAPMTPPPAPTAHYEAGAITVIWTASSDPNVVGYHVYRQPEGQVEERITTSPALIEEYLDGTVEDGMAYFYRVTAVDGELNESPHSQSTWIRAASAVPGALLLDRVYPNPVSTQAVFRFTIPEVGPGYPDGMYVTIDLFDVSGRSVGRVVEGHFQPGVQEVSWSPGESGRTFAPGTYVSVLRGGGQRVMERIAFVR